MQFRQLSSFCQSRSRIHLYLFSGHTSITLFSFTITSILIHWSASFFLCFLVRPFLLNFLGKTFLYCFLMRTFTIILGVRLLFLHCYTQFPLLVLFVFPFALPFWVCDSSFSPVTPNFRFEFSLDILLAFRFGCTTALFPLLHPIFALSSLWISF